LASGCSSISNLVSGDKIDYRSSGSKSVNLEVPPDLSQLTGQGRFTQSTTGPVSANAYSQQAQSTTTAASSSVAANTAGNVTLQRDGQLRWLSVTAAPEQVYPLVREFWLDNGFELPVDQANTGLMETNWSENRAKLPQDGVRNLIGKVLDSLYDTGERDQFRTRVERTAKGTDIYVSHRGLVEVYTDSVKKEQTTWKARPVDTGLEAEMLQRLMVKLGTPKDSAKATVTAANSAAATPRSRLLPDGVTVAFAGDYDQAWRRVGLALDRGGFTVEDRDRSKGVYEVRLATPGNPDGAKPGLFDRIGNLFGSKGSTDTITRYRLVVQSTNGDATVAVQTASGQAAGSAGGRDVAKQLNINLE